MNTGPNSSVLIIDLTDDMTEYLRHLNLIPRNRQLTVPLLERDIILNRLYHYVDVENVELKICPLHRYTSGIGWRVHNRCQHIDHHIPFQQFNSIKNRKSISKTPLRTAPLHLVEKIAGFPYGGKICDKHRKQSDRDEATMIDCMDINDINDGADATTTTGTESTAQSFVTPNKAERHQAKRVLLALEQSPIKSQTKTALLKQTPGAVRRLTAKLRKAVVATTTALAVSMAPGEADLLINVSISFEGAKSYLEIAF